jgi:hypothetical protein
LGLISADNVRGRLMPPSLLRGTWQPLALSDAHGM